MEKRVKEAIAPESSLPGKPACEVLKRDGMSGVLVSKTACVCSRLFWQVTSRQGKDYLQEWSRLADNPGRPA